MADLKLLIFGAGAIGTYVGASLLNSGQKVVFFDRPESAAAITASGLRLIVGEQSVRFMQPEIQTTLPEALAAGPFDAALVAVKSYDTPALAQQLMPFKAQLPPILCMQNGVENETILGDALGAEKIIRGTLTSAIGKPSVGTAVLERLRGIGVAGNHAVSARLVDGFNQAGLHTRLYSDGASMKWSKLLTNLLANASSAILNMPPSAIYTHKGLFVMEARQVREALAVMAKLNLRVVDLPGTPVRLLALLMQRFPAAIGQPLAVNFLGSGRGNKMPSFHIDLHSGNQSSEVGYLNGAVVKYGERVGVPTPVNRFLTETLLRLTAREIPIGAFENQPEKLLAALY